MKRIVIIWFSLIALHNHNEDDLRSEKNIYIQVCL